MEEQTRGRYGAPTVTTPGVAHEPPGVAQPLQETLTEEACPVDVGARTWTQLAQKQIPQHYQSCLADIPSASCSRCLGRCSTCNALELHRPRFLIPTNELRNLAIKAIRDLFDRCNPQRVTPPGVAHEPPGVWRAAPSTHALPHRGAIAASSKAISMT
jgi:hypothetical protein